MSWEQVIDTAAVDGFFLPDDVLRQIAVGRAHSVKLLRQVSLEAPQISSVGE